MMVLFIIIMIGYLANRLHIMTPDFTKKFTTLIVNVAIPAQIIGSVLSSTQRLSGRDLLSLTLASLVTYSLLILIGLTFPRLFHLKDDDRGTFSFMTTFSNVGFIGYPVVSVTLGHDAVFYTSLFNMPFGPLLYSLGLVLLSDGKKQTKFSLKQLFTPAFIASLISLGIFILKPSFPKPITDAAVLLGSLSVPGAMLIIGATLAQLSFGEVFTDFRIYPMSLTRLVVCPIIVWLALRHFVTSPIVLGIAILMAAMPVASNAVLLCIEYGGNEKLASKGIFISTLLSMLTIPLIIGFLLI